MNTSRITLFLAFSIVLLAAFAGAEQLNSPAVSSRKDAAAYGAATASRSPDAPRGDGRAASPQPT